MISKIGEVPDRCLDDLAIRFPFTAMQEVEGADALSDVRQRQRPAEGFNDWRLGIEKAAQLGAIGAAASQLVGTMVGLLPLFIRLRWMSEGWSDHAV